jgi:lysine 6-dehydrogenase
MKIAVLGAGLMGRAAAWDLIRSKGVERVLLADADKEQLRLGASFAGCADTRILDAGDVTSVKKALHGYDAAVSCVPYRYNEGLTAACIEAGVHLCDLGGNNDVVDAQFRLSERAERAGVTVIPDCGLAPGMVSVWAMDGFNDLDECESIRIRVGGLPVEPMPPLNYMKLFSVTGLINEYREPCRIISDGKEAIVEALSGLEKISFTAPFENMEAFYTSGGTSTLVKTLAGRVGALDYKTIRYPGHCHIFRTLAALGLMDYGPVEVDGREAVPRRVLEALLETRLPAAGTDVTLMRVECTGVKSGEKTTVRYQLIDYTDSVNGLSSMKRCTAFPAAAVARMLADGTIEQRGVLTQEAVVPAQRLFIELKKRGLEIGKTVVAS